MPGTQDRDIGHMSPGRIYIDSGGLTRETLRSQSFDKICDEIHVPMLDK